MSSESRDVRPADVMFKRHLTFGIDLSGGCSGALQFEELMVLLLDLSDDGR